MQWIAPSEKNADNAALEKRLWDAANQLRANSDYDTFGRVAGRATTLKTSSGPTKLGKSAAPTTSLNGC